jgi:hypothetical protein
VTKKALLAASTTSLLIAGCGLREPLRPAEGSSMPMAPALSSRQLTTNELLAVSSEMRPLRVDEPLTRSERRPIDRFDLPPSDVGGEVEGDQSELEDEPATATTPQ